MYALALLTGCPTSEPVVVTIDGPAEVRVEDFGPVDLPAASVSVEGAQVTWTVDPASVAALDGDRLDARAAGKATVTATYETASDSFVLVVAPPITLSFVDPPATLLVPTTVQLATATRIGAQPAIVEGVPTFVSSNDAFATVSPSGLVTAVAPGVVYLSAKVGRSEAMVEVEILPPIE